MERRRLGANGPEISVLGVGTAPIGSGADWIDWGTQDEAAATLAIHAALEAGANWIDTAPFYGWGRAEEIVGRALAGRRAAREWLPDRRVLGRRARAGRLPAPFASGRPERGAAIVGVRDAREGAELAALAGE